MMKPYQYIRSLILAFAVLSFSACSNDDYLQQTIGENVSVIFRPTLNGELSTRSIGDATGIDCLTVAVYEGSQTLSKKFSFSEDWDIVQRKGITLTLIEGHSYKILFWAEDEDNSAYSLTDDGRITVDYNNYINGGFAKMEELDAFCGTSSVTIGTLKVEDKGEIKLSRPLAQINFADNTTKPISGTHKAIVTYDGVPTSFNPFTGEIGMSENNIAFTFEDFPEDETLSANVNGSNNEYYYISSNYVFAPQSGTTATIKATLDLQNVDGSSIKKVELDNITIEQNKKTNILGSIVQQPETWSVWNGTIPTSSTITTDDQNRYIIDEADDVAWLSVKGNAQGLNPNSTFIMTVDVDMNNGSGLASIHFPAGSTLDGDGHTIKGLNLENALLGDVTDITVKNLNIEETVIENTSSAVTHIGVLVNTLKGSNTFSNIHIKNSSVSTQNGAAGGIVGYISRENPNNQEEELTVIFDNCHVTETTVDGTHSEGHFVGLLRGYDNKETLQFNSNCTLTLSAAASLADEFVSPYREGNEAVWLAGNDYSKYDGWLGNEECYRGTVIYGENRFIPSWDGVTKITPLTEGSTKLIYSAFDLASLQGGGHTTVTFKEDVDLGGDRTTNKNPFTPINTIGTLDGSSKTIYNLYINVTNWIGGFINTSSGTTVHKNLNFSNSSVLVKPSSGSEDAYAATLCAYIEGTYTAENINIDNAYVLGISKSGGLNGFVTASATFYTAKTSSVNNLRLENSYLHLTGETFAASGEMGGLVGFIQQSALVESCSVTNSAINCSNSLLRHVNQFIGTIRLDNSSQRIDINKCSVSGNTYENKKDEKSKFVGGYSLSSLLQRGKVYIDGKRLY